jgi:uncharacterized damage-inducible protein DinB
MYTVKDLLLEHLEYTFKKEGWQPPLSHAVAGLTAQQAAWKPGPERHSIWQIVRHVVHWKRGVLRAWDGDPPDYDAMSAADWREAGGDQAAWEADAAALHDLYADIRRRLEAASVADLEVERPWYQGAPPRRIATRLLHAFTHDIYHAGQIQYLRALQGIPADRLFFAAWDGTVSILREVLRAHPELVNAYNPSGWTALQMAASTGKMDAVRFLLDQGADVNAVSRNELQTTALKGAEEAGHGEVAELLRRRGAR